MTETVTAAFGVTAADLIGLYGVWFAFDFAYNHDAVDVFAWCVDLIKGFGGR